jgi:hypothetical protein
MPLPSDDDEKPLDQASAHMLGRVRRLMAISVVFTGLAVAAVLIVIGYRVFKSEGSRSAADVAAPLPAGAKVIATTVGDGRIVLTIEAFGHTELRVFDLATLKPRGRLTLSPDAAVSAPVR